MRSLFTGCCCSVQRAIEESLCWLLLLCSKGHHHRLLALFEVSSISADLAVMFVLMHKAQVQYLASLGTAHHVSS